MESKNMKVIATNKKAWHEYFIEETYEAGIVLSGTEVKSIRQGKVNLKDSYAKVEDGQVWISQMHISPYEQGNIFNKDPLRSRKLLLNRNEINKIMGYIQLQGYSLIPLKLYFKGSNVKMELALAKGKKLYDKRKDIATKDAKREIEKEFKARNQI